MQPGAEKRLTGLEEEKNKWAFFFKLDLEWRVTGNDFNTAAVSDRKTCSFFFCFLTLISFYFNFLNFFFLDFLIFYVAVRPNLAVLNLCLKSRGGGATVVSQMQRDSIFIYKSS